jgi:hypothetical protein
MTLYELSLEYRTHADTLKERVRELRVQRTALTDEEERRRMDDRIRMLTVMWREARDLAVLTERYYERGYHRNEHYTL